jgi:hypothetical protein
VKALRSADDRIDWTCANALGAADAVGGHYPGVTQGLFCAARWIEWDDRSPRECRQRLDTSYPAGRAAIDVSFAARDRFGIRATGRKAAARTLRLR